MEYKQHDHPEYEYDMYSRVPDKIFWRINVTKTLERTMFTLTFFGVAYVAIINATISVCWRVRKVAVPVLFAILVGAGIRWLM